MKKSFLAGIALTTVLLTACSNLPSLSLEKANELVSAIKEHSKTLTFSDTLHLESVSDWHLGTKRIRENLIMDYDNVNATIHHVSDGFIDEKPSKTEIWSWKIDNSKVRFAVIDTDDGKYYLDIPIENGLTHNDVFMEVFGDDFMWVTYQNYGVKSAKKYLENYENLKQAGNLVLSGDIENGNLDFSFKREGADCQLIFKDWLVTKNYKDVNVDGENVDISKETYSTNISTFKAPKIDNTWRVEEF